MGKKTSMLVNKKALFDYEVLDTYEAGIQLTGAEVKSLRIGRGQLKESYAVVRSDGNVELLNMHISAYPFARNEDYDSIRSRRLLLRRKEIETIAGVTQQKGVSLVPLKVYLRGGKYKVELGVVRGKKQFEKRDKKKRADLKREVARDFKLDLR